MISVIEFIFFILFFICGGFCKKRRLTRMHVSCWIVMVAQKEKEKKTQKALYKLKNLYCT